MASRWVVLAFCLCSFVAFSNAEIRDPESHFKEGEEHNAEIDHEAFLGKDQAQEFKELSPEESKERLKKLIPKIDKNGDGEISEEELRDHINYMQKRYVEKDVERTWKNYGSEKIADGKLSWPTYRDMVYGPESSTTESEGSPDSPDFAKMIVRDRRRWKKADTSEDDFLDRSEYACFMHPEDCPEMREIVTTETMEDIDKDGNGFVSLEEYIGDMYRPEDYPELEGKEPEWVASEREMFKDHRDKDKDGKLNMKEMMAWIMPEGFDHADAEAKHLIHMADDDKDMHLSLDEALTHYDVFVGSQATDYGEQLQKHDPSEL